MSVLVVLLLLVLSLLLYVAVRVGSTSGSGSPRLPPNRLLLLIAVGLLIVITARVFRLPAGRSSAPAPVAAFTPPSASPAVPSAPAAPPPATPAPVSPSSSPAAGWQVAPSPTPLPTDSPADIPSSPTAVPGSPTDTSSVPPDPSVTPVPFGRGGAGSPPAGCRCPPATATEASTQFGGNPDNWFRQDIRGDSWTYRSLGLVPLRFSVPDHSVVDLQQGRVFPGGVVTAADFTISWSADVGR